MTFGEFFKKLRLKKGLTLRQFCQEFKLDPGNISKLERDITLAPYSEEKIAYYAKALGLKPGSIEHINFFDLAVSSHKSFTIKNISEQDLLNKLPALFRTVDRKSLTPEKLDRIIKLVKKEASKK